MFEAMPSRVRANVWPFAVLVVLLSVVAAVAVWVQPSTPAAPATTTATRRLPIALLGDSITDQARLELVTALGPPGVRIEAFSGRKIVDLLPAARSFAAQHPEQVVINLGSNDVLLGKGADDPMTDAIASLHAMVDLYPSDTCVHVVTINETFFGIFPEGQEMRPRAQKLNAEIAAMAAKGRVDVIDWSALVYAALTKQPIEIPTTDTIHPTFDGRRQLVQLYRDAIARGCPR